MSSSRQHPPPSRPRFPARDEERINSIKCTHKLCKRLVELKIANINLVMAMHIYHCYREQIVIKFGVEYLPGDYIEGRKNVVSYWWVDIITTGMRHDVEDPRRRQGEETIRVTISEASSSFSALERLERDVSGFYDDVVRDEERERHLRGRHSRRRR
jgi:hypothetical protein